MSETLTERIKAAARRLGFQLVGVTTPGPPPHFEVFQRWLEAGRHGEMGYLAAERSRLRRADPRRILPECRSILVLGMRYPSAGSPEALAGREARDRRLVGLSGRARRRQGPEPSPGEGQPRGRVASYAWGQDYHDILLERLEALAARIQALAGGPFPWRAYTDTGPLLERDLAQRAGLGWIGKNTCLIHPALGSYFLLAELLLGIELEPDPPFLPDRCGSCTRCIEACPTDCILPDRTLDASRCLSYLTIELKGPIPTALRPLAGNWVFGCDVCQQVCPWNRRADETAVEPAFDARPGVPEPELVAELALSPDEYREKFKGSPLRRARRRGYLRNVAVALGNAGQAGAVPALARALLEEPEPLVRGHAAWALGEIGGEIARQALGEALAREQDPGVLEEICAALGRGEGALGQGARGDRPAPGQAP